MHVTISFLSRSLLVLSFCVLHFSHSFFLLLPSNVEYLSIEHLTHVEKNKQIIPVFLRSELHPVLLCVLAIYTFYCLPCFFFFCLMFFFAIRITTVHIENQTNKKSLVFFSFFLLCSNKNILDEIQLYYVFRDFILLDIYSRFYISWVCNLMRYKRDLKKLFCVFSGEIFIKF
jgi:hypothetical protein